MRQVRALRLVAPIAVLAAAAMALPSHAAKAKPGPNLLVNPGFEVAVAEPSPVPAATLPYTPMPSGWVPEGAALAFHNPTNPPPGVAPSGPVAKSGKRYLQISHPQVGNPRYCALHLRCTDNPTKPVTGAGGATYSLEPFWRSTNPIKVTPGTKYVLSVWQISWAPSVDPKSKGNQSKVRWLRADGTPVGESAGLLRKPATTSIQWTFHKTVVTPPKGAVSAVVMFGYAEDALSQADYDNAHFGTA